MILRAPMWQLEGPVMERTRLVVPITLAALSAILWMDSLVRHRTPSNIVRAQAAPAQPAPINAATAGKRVRDNPGFYAGEAGLNPSERAGREIWYKATAGNGRFHTYSFHQRVGVLIDWYRVLNANERGDRFAAWGIIN